MLEIMAINRTCFYIITLFEYALCAFCTVMRDSLAKSLAFLSLHQSNRLRFI